MIKDTPEYVFFRSIIESNVRMREEMYDETKPHRGKKIEAIKPIHTPHPIMSLPPESHVLLGFATSPHQYAYRVKRQMDNPERGGSKDFFNPKSHLNYFQNIIDDVQLYTKSDVREKGINIQDILEKDEYLKTLKEMVKGNAEIVTKVQKDTLKEISENAGKRLKERIIDEIMNIGIAENIISKEEQTVAQNNKAGAVANRVGQNVKNALSWNLVDADGNPLPMSLCFNENIEGKNFLQIAEIDRSDKNIPQRQPRISYKTKETGDGKMPGARDYNSAFKSMIGLKDEERFGIEHLHGTKFEEHYEKISKKLDELTYRGIRTVREGETVDDVAKATMLDYLLRVAGKNDTPSNVFSDFPDVNEESTDFLMGLHFAKEALKKKIIEDARPKTQESFKHFDQLEKSLENRVFLPLTESQKSIDNFKGVMENFITNIEEAKQGYVNRKDDAGLQKFLKKFGHHEGDTFHFDVGFFGGPSDLGAEMGPMSLYKLQKTMKEMVSLEDRLSVVFGKDTIVSLNYGQGSSEWRGANLLLYGVPAATLQGLLVDPTRSKATRMPGKMPTHSPSDKLFNGSVEQFNFLYGQNGIYVADWDENSRKNPKLQGLASKIISNNQGDRGAAGWKDYNNSRAIGKAYVRSLIGHLPMPLFPAARDERTNDVKNIEIEKQEFHKMIECPLGSAMIVSQLKQIGVNLDTEKAEKLGLSTDWTKQYMKELTKKLASPDFLKMEKFEQGIDVSNHEQVKEFALEALDALGKMEHLAKGTLPAIRTIKRAVEESSQLRPRALNMLDDYLKDPTDAKARVLAFHASSQGGNLAASHVTSIGVDPKLSERRETPVNNTPAISVR